MNELLQKHGCSNVFSVPEGLKELMSDISREVLRAQPTKIDDFIANYLSVLLITREHGVMAVSIIDDLCDCKPSVIEHLMQLGLEHNQAELLAEIIKEEIEETPTEEIGKETVKEYKIVKKILVRCPLDEVMTAKVCQVARNAYRDYWYRKMTLEKNLKMKPDEPWEIAAQRTLELYKRTKPSLSELSRATEKIQAAYRGYHVRRNLLRHLKPKKKKRGPKVDMLGPPIDIGGSREMEFGPLIDVKVHDEDINSMFDKHANQSLGLAYDPMKTITHVSDEFPVVRDRASRASASGSPTPGGRPSVSVSPSAAGRASVLGSPSATGRASVLGSPSATGRASVLGSPSAAGRASAAGSLAPEVVKSRVASVVSSLIPDAPQGGSVTQVVSSHGRPSQAAGLESVSHKISFAQMPPEVIPDEEKEALPTAPGEAEIPEDIPDDRTETESAPTASLPSSAPDTATTTDVEDEADEPTDATEEEG